MAPRVVAVDVGSVRPDQLRLSGPRSTRLARATPTPRVRPSPCSRRSTPACRSRSVSTQAIAGHADQLTTGKYDRRALDAKRDAVDGLRLPPAPEAPRPATAPT